MQDTHPTSDNDMNYDDLRPYYDSEIPAAMKRMAANPTLAGLVGYGFPGENFDDIREKLAVVQTSDEFQNTFMIRLLKNIIKGTMSSFTIRGAEYIDKSKGHLYISNHRDIVLDGSLLQLLFFENEIPTSEITFGSNLISSGFVEDFGRSNKMFKIVRGGSTRDLIQNSQILSKHIHDVVDEGRSIWISQRDGRTKDGNDRTDQGLVKMFAMEGGKDIKEALIRLNMVPVAISYEYESCDALKTREIYMLRRGPYVKAPGEDMRSIITGVQQYKGRVWMEACPAVEPGEIESLEGESNNDIFRGVAAIIDKRILSAYKLFETNYIAYDMREGKDTFAAEYTEEQKNEFIKYLHGKIDPIEGDRDELLDIILGIYANPVKNRLGL